MRRMPVTEKVPELSLGRVCHVPTEVDDGALVLSACPQLMAG
jgi:hypothetical protein